jgi:CDP-2,3-bis-(O-geranylgeranyl)-sn-glycerol synthase
MWTTTIHPWLILEVLLLLMVANGTPILAKKVFGDFLNHPLDGGVKTGDGQPLLGHSKTLRGIILAVVVTAIAALLMGLGPTVGLVIGAAAMFGDVLSSLLKRRMSLAPSSRALGLDQIPESVLPLLASQPVLQLTVVDIAIITVLFFVGELAISRLLFHLKIRDRPF